MSDSRPSTNRFHWLRNLGVYVAFVAALTLVLAIAAAVNQGVPDLVEGFGAWIFATGWLLAAGLFVLVPHLLVVGLLLRHGRRRRAAAVVLAAIIPSGGLFLSQLGHIAVTTNSALLLLSVAVVGAAYGVIVKLPDPSLT